MFGPVNILDLISFNFFLTSLSHRQWEIFCYVGSAVGYTASVFIAKKLKKKNQFILAACIMAFSAGIIVYIYVTLFKFIS